MIAPGRVPIGGNAGIVDSREKPATDIAMSVAKSGRPSRTGNGNSVITGPKNLTLLCDPYRRPYLRRSSPEQGVTVLYMNSEGLLWHNCKATEVCDLGKGVRCILRSVSDPVGD